jgi:5-formyltetrahydrofolate cyclo-ligase
MTKKEIRKYFKEKRQALSTKEMLRLDDLLLIQFQHWPLEDIQILLSYLPIKGKVEINTVLMADYLAFRIPGLRIAYPVMDSKEHILKPVSVSENTDYRENEFGIAEPLSGEEIHPEEIDAVFVPLLAFDKKGYRVGYGKGFYDRFLSCCRQDVLKIGFSYFDPVDAIEDINEFDVPLNVCITPNRLYEF